MLDVYPRVSRYRVWRLTHDGQVHSTYDLPEGYRLEDGLSGIAMNGDGSLLVELRGGAELAQVYDAAGRQDLVVRDGFRAHGRGYLIEYSDTLFGPATVTADGVEVEIDPDHDNGGVRFLGATADGDFFVEVDEVMMNDGPIRVDATVRRYSAAGRLLSQARRDLWPDSFTYVQGPLAVHGDDVYELQTREDYVAVTRKQFIPLLEPKLPEVPARRLTAVDAVDAALVLSRAAFPAGAGTALLARDDDFADGLTTGGTQGRLGAPLLLTPSDRLDRDVAAELDRLGVTTVHLLGGTAAVSATVQDALEARGITTHRLAGRDRVETSVAVARAAFPQAPVVLLVRGFAAAEPTQGFADALAVGAWAAEQGWPTLLTRTDRLPAAVANHLRAAGTRQVYVVGGTAAVSDGVVSGLRDLGINVTRVAGADRAGTALAVAKHRGAATVDDAGGLLLLDGSGAGAWAPGVASAAYAAGEGLQVILAAPDGLPGATARWLSAAHSPKPLVCAPFTTRSTCDAAMTAAGFP